MKVLVRKNKQEKNYRQKAFDKLIWNECCKVKTICNLKQNHMSMRGWMSARFYSKGYDPSTAESNCILELGSFELYTV